MISSPLTILFRICWTQIFWKLLWTVMATRTSKNEFCPSTLKVVMLSTCRNGDTCSCMRHTISLSTIGDQTRKRRTTRSSRTSFEVSTSGLGKCLGLVTPSVVFKASFSLWGFTMSPHTQVRKPKPLPNNPMIRSIQIWWIWGESKRMMSWFFLNQS